VLRLDAVVGLEVRDEKVQQEMIVPPDTSSGPLRNKAISPDNPLPASPPSPDPAGEGPCGAGALEMDSQLPELPSDETRKVLNDLLVPVRLKSRL
jgi:hypothetical protein